MYILTAGVVGVWQLVRQPALACCAYTCFVPQEIRHTSPFHLEVLKHPQSLVFFAHLQEWVEDYRSHPNETEYLKSQIRVVNKVCSLLWCQVSV